MGLLQYPLLAIASIISLHPMGSPASSSTRAAASRAPTFLGLASFAALAFFPLTLFMGWSASTLVLAWSSPASGFASAGVSPNGLVSASAMLGNSLALAPLSLGALVIAAAAAVFFLLAMSVVLEKGMFGRRRACRDAQHDRTVTSAGQRTSSQLLKILRVFASFF